MESEKKKTVVHYARKRKREREREREEKKVNI